MGNLRCCGGNNFLECCKPYFAMIALQFGSAGMNIITKFSLNRGMSHYVLVVYRQAIATAVMAPFVFIFERKGQPRITFPVFMQIFTLGLLGPVLDQNFYYAGMRYTSAAFAAAICNLLPAMTFVIAVLCRMEELGMKKLRGQAKVVGTVVSLAGAMVMTLYKGPVLDLFWAEQSPNKPDAHESATAATSDQDWFKGSIFLIISTLAWAFLFVLQAKALKTYKNHQLSLTTMVCFAGTAQSIAVTLAMERKAEVWKVGWDMNLAAAAYAGIVSSGITYYVQGLVVKKRGPVFATAFSPLAMVLVAVMGSFLLSENIFLGSVLGAVLIVIGLYSVLWGKHKEDQEIVAEDMSKVVTDGVNGTTTTVEDLEANRVAGPDKGSTSGLEMPPAHHQQPSGSNKEQLAQQKP